MDIQTIMLAIRIAQMIKQARQERAPQSSEDMSGPFNEAEIKTIEGMLEGVSGGERNIMIELIYNMLKSNNPDYHFPDLDSDEEVRLRTDDDPPAPTKWWDYTPPPRDDDKPIEKAWAFLKAEEPPERELEPHEYEEPEESIQSLMDKLMAGESLTNEQLMRLSMPETHGDGGGEPDADDDPELHSRTPTPMDWLDPFRMTRPHMALALQHIREELERRGGNRGMDAAREASANNPFFRHTRPEMRQAMQMMSDELERRGRPPISPEHFSAFDRGETQALPPLPRITDEERLEYIRNFEREWNRPRRGHPNYRGRNPSPPSPEQLRVRNMGDHLDESTFDHDELMSRLMSGDILTEKELEFLQEGDE